MYIHEAVRAAVEINGLIARRSFRGKIRIKPTNTDEGFIFINSKEISRPRWQPRAKDITADDWVIFAENVDCAQEQINNTDQKIVTPCNQQVTEKQQKTERIQLDVERLAKSYFLLRQGEWDPYIGPKPKGFDSLPYMGEKRRFRKRTPGRCDYTIPAANAILELVGAVNMDRLRWHMEQSTNDYDWALSFVAQYIENYQVRSYGYVL